MWTQDTIRQTIEAQRAFFRSNVTLDVGWRKARLKELKAAIERHEPELIAALHEDLGRCETEAYFCDIGSTILEINEAIAGLRRWARPQRHFSGIHCFPSVTTKVYKMPYGVTLILSPYNFPVLLSLGVLAASIAGGNTAILKLSAKTPHCTEAIKRLIGQTFDPQFVTVVDGGHDVADFLLSQRFDKIFYTGSPRVAEHVMEMAAHHLTPVTLELGGETGNWCIVRKDANLRDAARKVAFFKMLNAGQVCIGINQVAVAREVADEFVGLLVEAIAKQIGPEPLENPEYPRLVTAQAYNRCANDANDHQDRIVCGGKGDPKTLRYAPTVIYPVDIDDPLVRHELFCPLLPVVTFKDNEVDYLMSTIAQREHGLALYLFTRDKAWARRTMRSQQFGGGCINEVCLHLVVRGVPFGGVGRSGMGSYHGEWGFREFTHPCTVLEGKTRLNLPLREHPYSGKLGGAKLAVLKLLER